MNNQLIQLIENLEVNDPTAKISVSGSGDIWRNGFDECKQQAIKLLKSSPSEGGSKDEFDYRQWCDDKTEEIIDKFDAAGTPVRGGACILYALEEAYKLGKNA